jgi:hypothetical protein
MREASIMERLVSLGTQGIVGDINTKVSTFRLLDQLHPGRSILLPVHRPLPAFVHFMWQCRSHSMWQQCCESSSIAPQSYYLESCVEQEYRIKIWYVKKPSRQLRDAHWQQERF